MWAALSHLSTSDDSLPTFLKPQNGHKHHDVFAASELKLTSKSFSRRRSGQNDGARRTQFPIRSGLGPLLCSEPYVLNTGPKLQSPPPPASNYHFNQCVHTCMISDVDLSWNLGRQGQSGQAIKLFRITPYVNDFQTLNNPGSWQPVRPRKLVLPSIFDINLSFLMMWNLQSYTTTVLNEIMWHFRGSKHTLTSYIFSGVKTLQPPRIDALAVKWL